MPPRYRELAPARQTGGLFRVGNIKFYLNHKCSSIWSEQIDFLGYHGNVAFLQPKQTTQRFTTDFAHIYMILSFYWNQQSLDYSHHRLPAAAAHAVVCNNSHEISIFINFPWSLSEVCVPFYLESAPGQLVTWGVICCCPDHKGGVG